MESIDWSIINAKLPVSNTKEDRDKRMKMFRKFDPDGNGFLSFTEVNEAIRKILNIDEVFNVKPAIDKAFQIAKNSKPSKRGDLGSDSIETGEFKFFLLSVRQYFEYYVAFIRVDADADQKISLEEFKSAQCKIELWVGRINPEKTFKKIDKQGLGYIQFDDFCKWAIKQNLDLQHADD